MMEHGSQSLGASQRRQRLDTKTAGSAAGQPVWNMTATRPKKAVLYGALGMQQLGWGWEYSLMMVG